MLLVVINAHIVRKNIRIQYYDDHVEECKNKTKKIGVISYKEIAKDPRMSKVIDAGIKSMEKSLNDQKEDLSLISSDAERKIFGENNDN